MSDEKKESWGAILGGCLLWVAIISALIYGAVMVVAWFKNNEKETQKALAIKENAAISNAEVFSIDSPFFNSPVVVYRVKIGDVYYVIVQGKSGSVAICPEPTDKRSVGRGVNEIF